MEITDALPDPDLSMPLSQHPMFAAALTGCGHHADVYSLRQGSRRLGQVLLVRRRFGPFGRVALASRGPVWQNLVSVGDRVDALRALRGKGLRLIEAEAADCHALRASGFRAVTTPAHVAELDLQGGPAAIRARTQGKWRNRMSQADRAGVTVRSLPFRGEADHWLLKQEAAQRRLKHYAALPAALTAVYARVNPGMARLFVAERDGAQLAAMLFLRHGPVVTYQIGWSGEEGRAVSAHHLMLMLAADWFAARGHLRLDLGSVDSEAAPGLARFKLGSGAQMRALGGSWLRLPI